MKILFISTTVFPVGLSKYGGIEKMILNWIEVLAEWGYPVACACPQGSRLPKGVERIETVDTGYQQDRDDLAYYNYCDRLGDFDVIHDFSHQHQAALVHDNLPVINMIWDPGTHRYQRPRYNLMCLSRWQAERIANLYGLTVKFEDLPIDTDKYKFHAEKSDRFLFIGKMTPEKGALDAISMCKEIGAPLDVCLPRGNLVFCNSHLKDISEVNEHDHVLSSDGMFHKVQKKIEREYKGELINIKTSILGDVIQTTPNHPFLVLPLLKCSTRQFCRPNQHFSCEQRCAKRRNYNFEPIWKKADDIKVGDCLLFPIPREVIDRDNLRIDDWIDGIVHNGYIFTKQRSNLVKNTWQRASKTLVPNIIPITSSLMKLLGYYVAEGSSSGRMVSFSFGMHEIERIEEVARAIAENFRIPAKILPCPKKRFTKVSCNSSVLCNLFRVWFGENAITKRVPSWIIKLPPEKTHDFVEGLLAGDGWWTSDGHAHYSTRSRVLAYQLVALLSKMGIIARCYRWKPRNSFSNNPVYEVSICGKNVEPLLKEAAVVSKKHHSRAFFYKGFICYPVKRVEKSSFNGVVYNLEVENDHSFVAQSFVVHNCGGKLPTDPRDYELEVIRACDDDQIVYHGNVTDQVKIELLQHARALIYPLAQGFLEAHWHGGLEALSCGTPVICYLRGAHREVIDHGKVGYVVEARREFLDAMKNIDNIKPENCREFAERRYDRRVIVKRYLEELYIPLSKGLRWH